MSIFKKKIQTVGTINEFMSNEWKWSKNDKQTLGALAVAPIVTLFKHDTAAAGAIGETIKRAFDPIIDLVQGVSYPVCFLMLCGGFLLVMINQKHRGMTMIKWAAIGYIGMQLAPALMDILVDIGKAMRGGA